MPELVIEGLTKKFADSPALRDISLRVADGELLTLLGPSGCGKSTTLWSIAGLHRPDGGVIRIGDTVVFDGRINVEPERRGCGVVFQSYAIWPHMKVKDNVAFPLKMHKVRGRERDLRVKEALELVEMEAYADRYPHELSGGQQQRVALARALASPPKVLLLDEPFSNLDAKLRERARGWLRELQQQIGVTTVFVTHDQDEALSMSDRIAVMSAGELLQVGTPEEIYRAPVDRFVADFVGTSNLFEAVAAPADGGVSLSFPGLDAPFFAGGSAQAGACSVVVRPEEVRVLDTESTEPIANVRELRVLKQVFLGDHYLVHLQFGDHVLLAYASALCSTDTARIAIAPQALRLLPQAQTTIDIDKESVAHAS